MKLEIACITHTGAPESN